MYFAFRRSCDVIKTLSGKPSYAHIRDTTASNVFSLVDLKKIVITTFDFFSHSLLKSVAVLLHGASFKLPN